MAVGQTEPSPPPAYQAVHAAHQRLAEAERQLRWRESVDAAIAVEEQRLDHLWRQLAEEQADVAALELRTLRSIRSRLRRTHEADIEAEKADVRAVEAEIALRFEAIDAIDASPGRSTVEAAVQAVQQARTDLDDALAWWGAEHIAAGTQLGLQLADLDRLATYLHALRRELHEALDVARLASVALDTARRPSKRRPLIERLGEPPTPHAEAIANVQRWLLELRAELHDLGQLEVPQVDGPEVRLPSLDIGPGDLFDDWIVNNRVLATTIAIDATQARVELVADGLAECADRLDTEIDGIERESRELLLQHPGVVW